MREFCVILLSLEYGDPSLAGKARLRVTLLSNVILSDLSPVALAKGEAKDLLLMESQKSPESCL